MGNSILAVVALPGKVGNRSFAIVADMGLAGKVERGWHAREFGIEGCQLKPDLDRKYFENVTCYHVDSCCH